MGNRQSTIIEHSSRSSSSWDEKRLYESDGSQVQYDGSKAQSWLEWMFGMKASGGAIKLPEDDLYKKHKSSADDELRKIYEAEWAWREKEGMIERGGIPDHLPHMDAASQARRLHHWRRVMNSLAKIDQSELSTDMKINFGVYVGQIKTFIDQGHFKDYEKPITGDTAFWSDHAYVARLAYHSKSDYENYLSQLEELPRYFGEQMDNMRAGLKRSFTPPKVTLQGREASITSVIDAKLEDSVYYKPFLKMPSSVSKSDQEKLKKRISDLINSKVIPTHKTLLKFFLDEYYPNAREALAAEDLPDGKAYYQAKIREFTTTNMSPQEIHDLGLKEIKRIREEMDAVIASTGFKGEFKDFLKYLRTDKQFYAKTPEELLKDAAWIAKEFDGVSGQFFGRLPRERFAIVEVPPDIAPFYTSGRGGPGQYLVNTYDLPSRGLYSLPALTLHESAPGHCFQMSLVKEHDNLPKFRSEYISAYGEGWGLYCEHLGVEMGIYHTPYETFGMLSYQAWRAARLVVDTGVHALGWSREQAQNYVQDNTALSIHEVETEVDRYISWPGQSLAYYIGMLVIRDERAKAEKALGDKFDIRAFHDTVLQTGSVPLPVLTGHIERWVKKGGKSPYSK